jgi:hypothetical protein
VRFYLLTVESSYQFGALVQVLPRVRLAELAERGRDLLAPQQGDPVELALPGGGTRMATIGSFGIEAWRQDGRILTSSDPADPVLTLNLEGTVRPADVPPGTEIWLAEARHTSTAD